MRSTNSRKIKPEFIIAAKRRRGEKPLLFAVHGDNAFDAMDRFKRIYTTTYPFMECRGMREPKGAGKCKR